MLIGEFCTRSGLSKDAVRHYESIGLLVPTMITAGSRRYRRYAEDSLERIELIQIGSQSGMTLREMQPILSELMAGNVSFDGQRQILRNQISRINERIAEMNVAKQRLTQLFGEIDKREQDLQQST